MKQEIPTPIAVGLIVIVLAVLGFFVYRWVSAPAPTISAEELPNFGSGPSAPMAPASPVPQGPNASPYRPPSNFGAPGGR